MPYHISRRAAEKRASSHPCRAARDRPRRHSRKPGNQERNEDGTRLHAHERPQERAGRETSNHARERSRRATSRPCRLPVCARGHPRPPSGSSWQNRPHAHRAKCGSEIASRFFGRFWTGNAPQGDAAPGPADMGEARPQDEPFPAPLAAMGADREPTGSADGPGRLARAAILDRLRRPCPARPIDICGGRARPSRRTAPAA